MRLRASVRVASLCLLGATAIVAAQEAEAPPAAEPARLDVSGLLDGYFAYNANQPANHANFFPGVGTSGQRDNEFAINLAQVDFVLAPRPVGFKVSLGFGNSPEVVHAAEARGIATHPDVWRNVVQASAQWQTGVGRGLLLEAGVYPSHIGMESFQTHLNWNYTRSWLGELSPYYQTGLKLVYPLSDRWSAQLHLLNGWQMIGDVNRGKSVGGQVAYGAERFSISFNGIIGPELADNDDDYRALGDVVATWKATKSLSLGVSGDVAREGRPDGNGAAWAGVGLYARFAPPGSRTAVAVRGEYYDDEDGAISGIAQTLKEITLTLEHRPVPRLILKLEGRYDKSSALAFAGDQVDPGGNPLRRDDQFLILLGAVVTF
ncbi:MAG TPA: porin [Vicinamibacteria bacterium]|nr:porin [Vicinamibacteria bacterium]